MDQRWPVTCITLLHILEYFFCGGGGGGVLLRVDLICLATLTGVLDKCIVYSKHT